MEQRFAHFTHLKENSMHINSCSGKNLTQKIEGISLTLADQRKFKLAAQLKLVTPTHSLQLVLGAT